MEEEKPKGKRGGARPGAGRKRIHTDGQPKLRTFSLSPEADAILDKRQNISAYINALILADNNTGDPVAQIEVLAEKIKTLAGQLKNN